MKESLPKIVELKNYRKPDYYISDIFLTFELSDHHTHVTSEMSVHAGSTVQGILPALILNGENLILKQVFINEIEITSSDYQLTNDTMVIAGDKLPGREFKMKVINEIDPAGNLALDGLYKSGSVFCTQNEPEGFRRITYFIDRPDVMARYQTKIIADQKSFPVLLSNGNEMGKGELPGGKHWVWWQDPFPKPSYLFALVAGDLGLLRDSFHTKSGRTIDLRLYCDKGNESQCQHAMNSLKVAMKWDEDVYGLEYDLDIYMIVAVDAFNMGAMENKGLNIFNTSCVLFGAKTATDYDYRRVEGVVAHEYFHNWTGNRVTCRDWFQLTLKEGLTVFRDQEFSADVGTRAYQRIIDVQSLRLGQFAEDASPMAHPIRPETYMEINNFYTHTVYNKGAEVIRMLYRILGAEKYQQAINLYFQRFDGMAVTTEDFFQCMENTYGQSLAPFARWYHQAGTPTVVAKSEYNETAAELTVTLTQSYPQKGDDFYIPLEMSLLGMGMQGKELDFVLVDNGRGEQVNSKTAGKKHTLLHLRTREQVFHFQQVKARPLLSLNRNFTAPVRLQMNFTHDELMFLLGNETDQFNRWEAHQQLCLSFYRQGYQQLQAGAALSLPANYFAAFAKVIEDQDLDPLIKAKILQLPEESLLYDELRPLDFQGLFQVRETYLRLIAIEHRQLLLTHYQQLVKRNEFLCKNNGSTSAEAFGVRELKNTLLGILMRECQADDLLLCVQQFTSALTMTDEITSLKYLTHFAADSELTQRAQTSFYQKYQQDLLITNKYLSVVASTPERQALSKVKQLLTDPIYHREIPNCVRSLIGSLVSNPIAFHHESGEGYEFLAQQICDLDGLNPQMAGALAAGYNKLSKVDANRKALMLKAIEKILLQANLSKNVLEILNKIKLSA